MRVRRIIGATVVAGIAAGVGLLAAGGVGVAATPAPTPVSLNALGLSSANCPLPLGTELAFKPGTTIQFKPDMVLGALQTLSLSIQREVTTTPKPAAQTHSVPTTGVKVAFANSGIYDLSWHTITGLPLGGVSLGATQNGKLVFSANTNVQKCVVGVQLPAPSVSASALPSPITSAVNGILSSGASAVNGVLSPVNSAVGPVLGGVNSTVGGVIAPITGGANPITGGGTGSGTGPGTIYKPTGPTVAQKTVPQNAGSGNGAAGSYVGTTGNSINAPALGFKGTGGSGSAGSSAVKSGGSPKTVELAANKPRSALNGFSTVIVVIAIVALSGATAFYARTFLLHPPQAQA
jgi:hypothetical protein